MSTNLSEVRSTILYIVDGVIKLSCRLSDNLSLLYDMYRNNIIRDHTELNLIQLIDIHKESPEYYSPDILRDYLNHALYGSTVHDFLISIDVYIDELEKLRSLLNRLSSFVSKYNGSGDYVLELYSRKVSESLRIVDYLLSNLEKLKNSLGGVQYVSCVSSCS